MNTQQLVTVNTAGLPAMENPHNETLRLIERLRARDRKALDRLYQMYGGAVLGTVSRMVPTQQEAEEVLQDTFLKVWQKVESYDPDKGRFFTWLIQIARRTALDKTKTVKAKKQRETQRIDPLDHPEGSLGVTEMYVPDSGLRSVIDTMKPSRRQVVDHFYFLGMTQQQVSDKLNMPLGTVKTELRKALIDLRTLLPSRNS